VWRTAANKKPRISAVLGKRADTRGGLSKGLGAFRIGRPLGLGNGWSEKAFRAVQIFLRVTRRHLGLRMFGRCRFRGMAVGGTEQERQQQHARDQAFEGMFQNEGWNTRGAISFRCRIFRAVACL
jgi:hypothetical protein